MDKPKPQKAWGWYNYAVLIGTERTRREAIAGAEKHSGRPWDQIKSYIQVRKVIVTVEEA